MQRFNRCGWIVLGWLIMAGLAQAAMYKWVDENGVTQYTQYPPPNLKAEKVAPPPPPAVPPEEATQQLNSTLQKQAEQRSAAETAKAEQAKAKQEAAQRKLSCEKARSDIGILTAGGHRQLTDKDGVDYYPTEEERQQRITDARQREAEFCK